MTNNTNIKEASETDNHTLILMLYSFLMPTAGFNNRVLPDDGPTPNDDGRRRLGGALCPGDIPGRRPAGLLAA